MIADMMVEVRCWMLPLIHQLTRWGLEQEKYSVGVYTNWLWVTDPTVSPTQGLVDLKNPYSYRHLSVSDAISNKKCDCLEVNNGRIQLKQNYSYYCQVQLTMFCTDTQWCDFILCTTVDCERVQFNKSFCTTTLPTLRRFYTLAILPELSLKANWEPKDWLTNEDSFVQEMERLLSWMELQRNFHTFGNQWLIQAGYAHHSHTHDCQTLFF